MPTTANGPKMRYFPGFNDEEMLPKPPKKKLKRCSRRFCLHRVYTQEISPEENLERFNTLCEKHKQQVHLAASEVVKDWHTPNSPAGLTPTRPRKVKPAPQTTARATRPAPELEPYREQVNEAKQIPPLCRCEREAQEARERAPKRPNRYATQKPEHARRVNRYASVYRQRVDVFNPY